MTRRIFEQNTMTPIQAGWRRTKRRARSRNPVLDDMRSNIMAAYGQGNVFPGPLKIGPCVAQRNLLMEEMGLNILAAYGQGIIQCVPKLSSMMMRWRHRLYRRYGRMKK